MDSWVEKLKKAEKTCLIQDGNRNEKFITSSINYSINLYFTFSSFFSINYFNFILKKIKGKRKIHYTFEDRTEMAEEYSMQSSELLSKRIIQKLIFKFFCAAKAKHHLNFVTTKILIKF